MPEPTADKSLIGAAGVHFVSAELSLRGLIALPTVRNTAGVDVIAVDKAGTWVANIQVKSSRNKAMFWIVGKHHASWRGPNNYYVFVRYVKAAGRFEAFLETSERVSAEVSAWMAKKKQRGLKEWAPCWFLPDDIDRLRQQWDNFGPPVKDVLPQGRNKARPFASRSTRGDGAA